jgi:hypothetical protein
LSEKRRKKREEVKKGKEKKDIRNGDMPLGIDAGGGRGGSVRKDAG